MDNRFTMASIAGGITLFVVGFLLWGLAFAGFFEANMGTATGVMQDPPNLLWLGLGQLMGGVFLALALGWKGVTSSGDGFKAGAVLGLVVALFYDLTMLGTTHIFTTVALIVDVLLTAVALGLAGAVVGRMLGRGQPA